MAVPASYPLEIASSIINFGAWRSWQRGCFGSIRSQIRFLPPRPHKSETGRCRSFSRGNRTQELGVAGTRNRTPLEHWPRGPRQRLAKPWSRKRLVRSNRTCSAGFFITYSDPLTQRPECLPVQEEAKGSTPLRIATHHAEIAQTVSASVADSISALGTTITGRLAERSIAPGLNPGIEAPLDREFEPRVSRSATLPFRHHRCGGSYLAAGRSKP